MNLELRIHTWAILVSLALTVEAKRWKERHPSERVTIRFVPLLRLWCQPPSEFDLWQLWLPCKGERKHGWSAKAQRWNSMGTGQIRHLKLVYGTFRHGFREEATPKPKRTTVVASSSSWGFPAVLREMFWFPKQQQQRSHTQDLHQKHF